MTATLSIIGLLEMDPTILNGMTIPEGLDFDTLKNNIILECAELEVLYAAPSFFRWAVDVWSLKESPTWERMYKAAQLEYNPIENYDRIEEWTENGTHENNKSADSTSSGSSNVDSSGDTQHNVTGYNSNSEVLQSRDISSATDNSTSNATASGSERETGKRTNNSSGRVHGNIGVVTSQQMLKAEYDLAPEINMYNYITRSFKNRFCLLIY